MIQSKREKLAALLAEAQALLEEEVKHNTGRPHEGVATIEEARDYQGWLEATLLPLARRVDFLVTLLYQSAGMATRCGKCNTPLIFRWNRQSLPPVADLFDETKTLVVEKAAPCGCCYEPFCPGCAPTAEAACSCHDGQTEE